MINLIRTMRSLLFVRYQMFPPLNSKKMFFNNIQRGVKTMATSLVTERVYYQDPYLDKLDAKIVKSGKDETGIFFVPDRTIFHPQGGGQPSDKGFAEISDHKFAITGLQEEGGEIKHYFENKDDTPLDESLSNAVKLTIDLSQRTLYTRLHSGGHLLSSVVEEFYPHLEGYRGNHFPNTSFVVFKGAPLPVKAELLPKVEKRAAEILAEKRPVRVDNGKDPRTAQMEGLKEYPCGGTHVRDSSEIGSLTIRSFKKEKGELKLGYDVDKK